MYIANFVIKKCIFVWICNTGSNQSPGWPYLPGTVLGILYCHQFSVAYDTVLGTVHVCSSPSQELINICEGLCAGLGVEQHAFLGEPLHPRQCSQGGQGVTRPGSDHNDR